MDQKLWLWSVGVLMLFMQSLNAFTGETEIAQVRVLDAQAGRMKLEIVPADSDQRNASREKFKTYRDRGLRPATHQM